MKFDDQNVDASQLQDVRGQRGGGSGGFGGMSRGTAIGGGGLGIVGLLLALFLG